MAACIYSNDIIPFEKRFLSRLHPLYGHAFLFFFPHPTTNAWFILENMSLDHDEFNFIQLNNRCGCPNLEQCLYRPSWTMKFLFNLQTNLKPFVFADVVVLIFQKSCGVRAERLCRLRMAADEQYLHIYLPKQTCALIWKNYGCFKARLLSLLRKTPSQGLQLYSHVFRRTPVTRAFFVFHRWWRWALICL